jgi:hypothetical protein
VRARDQVGQCFTVLSRDGLAAGKMGAVLKFRCDKRKEHSPCLHASFAH